MRFLKTYGLLILAILIASICFYFRPAGITGPRAPSISFEGKGFDYTTFDEVLASVSSQDGLIDYAALQKNRASLDHFLGQIRAQSPKNQPHRFHSNEDRVAYYLNAYNAFVLAAILDLCPLESVSSVYALDGFFWRISFLMGEEEVTLNGISGERLAEFQTAFPQIPFALVRGAKGSPALPSRAYRGESLKADLEGAARRAVENPRLLKREGSKFYASEIFQWAQVHDLPHFVAQFHPDWVEGKPEVEFVPFDWSLNGTCGAQK